MKKQSDVEKEILLLCLRKENEIFKDLCNIEKDKIARIIERHNIDKDELISQLEKYDNKISDMLNDLLYEESSIKLKISKQS